LFARHCLATILLLLRVYDAVAQQRVNMAQYQKKLLRRPTHVNMKIGEDASTEQAIARLVRWKNSTDLERNSFYLLETLGMQGG
jgi:hypothetical protein